MTTAAVDKTFEYEQRTLDIWFSAFPVYTWVEPLHKRTSTSIIDGMVTHNSEWIMLVEQKTRNISLDDLQNKYGNELLVNYEKIVNLCKVSKQLQTRAIMWTYLVPDDVVIETMLTSARGNLTANIRTEYGGFQRSANGGLEDKSVAYISCAKSRILTHHQSQVRPQSQTDTNHDLEL